MSKSILRISEKIGLIGAGNMGSAIIGGLLAKKMIGGGQVWIYDKIQDKARGMAKQHGLHLAASCGEVAANAEILLLAVKPQDLQETAGEFKSECRKEQVLISILAGTPIVKISEAVGGAPSVVRAMPNLGAKVGAAVTAVTSLEPVALTKAQAIFSGCGAVVPLEEKYFDLVTAVSGSGPAYFFFLMELMAQHAETQGLSAQDARELAVQTALGAALLARDSKEGPGALRKMVTSKGGTTEAALDVLFENKFPDIFKEALRAAQERGRKLSQIK